MTFLEFLELYFIFFHEILHTDAKWQFLKCNGVRFCKNFFSGRKCRKYAEKTGFWAFSRDFIISFFSFFAQRSVLGMPKTLWSHVIFFPLKMPEIAVFAVFHFHLQFLHFFLIFLVLFLSDSHHQVGPFSTLLVYH